MTNLNDNFSCLSFYSLHISSRLSYLGVISTQHSVNSEWQVVSSRCLVITVRTLMHPFAAGKYTAWCVSYLEIVQYQSIGLMKIPVNILWCGEGGHVVKTMTFNILTSLVTFDGFIGQNPTNIIVDVDLNNRVILQ